MRRRVRGWCAAEGPLSALVTATGLQRAGFGQATLKRGFRRLLAEAEAEIETIPVKTALDLVDDDSVLIVDLRDIHELWRDGTIPGSLHAPRGMLEFWIDPDCPYHREEFSSGRELVFFCGSAWRSALAVKAVQDMGITSVAHIAGGFGAWRKAGGPVEQTPQPAPRVA